MKRPAPPSSSAAGSPPGARGASRPPSAARSARAPRTAPRTGRRQVDVQQWLGGIRLSGFMAIMLGLVVLAAFVLVPTLGVYLDQRQQVAALEQAVEVSRDEVEALEAERERWTDPAYITTQARERLYYVKPGEVIYLVDDDLPPEAQPQDEAPVSDEVGATRTDWMSQLVRSATAAGIAQVVREPAFGVPDEPVPSPTATPTP